jgi:hypothetical protein
MLPGASSDIVLEIARSVTAGADRLPFARNSSEVLAPNEATAEENWQNGPSGPASRSGNCKGSGRRCRDGARR